MSRRTEPAVGLLSGQPYRNSAKTDVARTIEAERRRIGALSGAQVRAMRKRQPQHELADVIPISGPAHIRGRA